MAWSTACISSLFLLARSWDPMRFFKNLRHLSDEVPHKLVVLSKPTFGVGWLGLQCILCGLVSFLQSSADFISGSHFNLLL